MESTTGRMVKVQTEKTLRELTQEDLQEGRFYLDTARGKQKITGMRPDWWVDCREANGGHGRSYSCTPNEIVKTM